jgi:hypothetical protein
MLDEGVYASVNEIGDAENISKGYVSRILRLALRRITFAIAGLDRARPSNPRRAPAPP